MTADATRSVGALLGPQFFQRRRDLLAVFQQELRVLGIFTAARKKFLGDIEKLRPRGCLFEQDEIFVILDALSPYL